MPTTATAAIRQNRDLTFIEAALVHLHLVGLHSGQPDWWREDIVTDELMDWVYLASNPSECPPGYKTVPFSYRAPNVSPDLAWCKRIARRLIKRSPTLPAWARLAPPSTLADTSS